MSDDKNQSVKYLNGLETPAFIAIGDFERVVENFITAVIHRLNALECPDTMLSNLWQLLQMERADHDIAKYRRIEAKMGCDPDECSEEFIDRATALDQKMGTATLSELAPIYGKSDLKKPLTAIEEIADGPGLIGVPVVPHISCDVSAPQDLPWQRAVSAVESLRQALNNTHGMMDNAVLDKLLGLSPREVEKWSPVTRNDVAITIPGSGNQFKFIPRKSIR